jgi:hypothetical protein
MFRIFLTAVWSSVFLMLLKPGKFYWFGFHINLTGTFPVNQWWDQTPFMTPLRLWLLAAMAFQLSCLADVTKLPTEHRKVLQDASRFHEIHTVTNLPASVVALCADQNGRLAEPGQKWEPTDVIRDQKLPRKHLIWATKGDDYYVIHYESGGRGHGYHVIVAELKAGQDKPSFLWHAVGDKLKDYKTFLDALEHNKLRDELNYAR